MIRRRQFIAGLGGAAAWPVVARAQQGERMRRIGVLVSGAEDDPYLQERLARFRQRLEILGWSEVRNARIDSRFASAPDRYAVLAKELVALEPDVIVAVTTRATAAMQHETHTIPIIFIVVSDPIGSGFVGSRARPGGNLTGFSAYEEGLTGKWLAMLKEIDPGLRRAALMGNPDNIPYDYFLRGAQTVAPSLEIDLVPIRVVNVVDIERAIESVARTPNGGLVVLPSVLNLLNRDVICALAARYRLPAVYVDRAFVIAGGLISYAPVVDEYREAASYVDRILRGANPADLPVQAPVKYETVINLKTAKALGITIPETLLATADEVIQ